MDVTIIATYRCNSKCQMCYIWQNPTHPRDEISLKTLAKLPGGFDHLNVSGGEPTLREDLHEMIDTLYPKARVTEISSNGQYAERLIPIIRRYPNIKVRFSLEGDEATNDRIRGEAHGFTKKVHGLRKLQEAGGRDLGFAMVIQDENADQIVQLYELCRAMGVEMATSTLHNAWQFHKNDNYFYDRLAVAKKVEQLITAMLKTHSVKNWFRAYLNLGLIRKILGQDRLIPCTAATDFAFIDPWGDVWGCNVRTDLPLGNLNRQSWAEILSSDLTRKSRAKVAACPQNCWMVTTARTAMRSRVLPSFPKLQPLLWVLKNKLKVSLGRPIRFQESIDYADVTPSPLVKRTSFLERPVRPKLQRVDDPHYVLEEFFNR